MKGEEMTKPELLALIQSGREELVITLSALDSDQMTVTGVEGDWSVKDILFHIAVWEEQMVHWLDEAVRGQVPQPLPGLPSDELDRWNEQIYLEHRDRSLHEALERFRQAYTDTLQAVEQMSEEDLLDPQRFAWRRGKPLWRMVAADTFEHDEEHGKAIEAWLAGLGTA